MERSVRDKLDGMAAAMPLHHQIRRQYLLEYMRALPGLTANHWELFIWILWDIGTILDEAKESTHEQGRPDINPAREWQRAERP